MPDLDAIDDLTRLPAAASGGPAKPPMRQAASAAPAPAGAPALTRTGLVLSHLDVVVVLAATPVALSLGAPALGYALAAGAWLAQRVLAQLDSRWIRNTREPSRQMGLNLFEAFGRIWLLAGAIVAAGLIGTRADGLTAAVVVFVAYSIAFAMRVIDGRPQGGTEL
jgi:hypothetical protein